MNEGEIGGLRFSVLGSSSKGNCTLVSGGSTTILIDSGLPSKYIHRNVRMLTGADNIEGIFISHEHGDHINSLGPVSRNYGCPVYLSSGVAFMLRENGIDNIIEVKADIPVDIGDLRVTPFCVQHDAIEPFGFLVESKGIRLGIATDLGMVGPDLIELLRGLDGLVIESNYDREMLARGPYPYPLKRRILDRKGHLSNIQCRDLIKTIIGPGTTDIVLAHLSEENNDPLIAAKECSKAVGGISDRCRLHISYPRYPTPYLELGRVESTAVDNGEISVRNRTEVVK